MIKHIKIGTHEYTSLQLRILQALDIDPEPITVFKTVYDPEAIVQLAKNTGAMIIVQNLQFHKIVWLWKTAQKYGIPVYMFYVEKKGIVDESECPLDHDIRIKQGEGKVKCAKTKNLSMINGVSLGLRPLAVAPQGSKNVVVIDPRVN